MQRIFPSGSLISWQPAHGGDLHFGMMIVPPLATDGLRGGIDVFHVKGTFEAIDLFPGHNVVPLLPCRPAPQTSVSLPVLMVKKPAGRHPTSTGRPSRRTFGTGYIISMDGKEGQVVRHRRFPFETGRRSTGTVL